MIEIVEITESTPIFIPDAMKELARVDLKVGEVAL